MGPECLPTVLVDVPTPEPTPPPGLPRTDWLVAVGFAMVLAASVFPWSRYGGAHLLNAWDLHWSLLAVVVALAGLTLAVTSRARPIAPPLQAASYLLLSLVVIAAVILHRRHPPPLAVPSAATWFALVGAALALIGAILKMGGLVRARSGRA